MGYSMRADRYRYTEWQDFSSGDVLKRELYDHADSDAEIYNVAGDARYSRTLNDLSARLRGGWIAALPQPGLASAAQ